MNESFILTFQLSNDSDLGANLMTQSLTLIVSTIKDTWLYKDMVEMHHNGLSAAGPSKKRMLPSEISHKFSSKEDFLYFFSKQVSTRWMAHSFVQCQLYTPPKLMCNIDVMRQVVSGEKMLIPMSQVKMVDIPQFGKFPLI